jgi:UDP-GlcNAc:undecaprenyl-phosphate/decaprenyl-phosphate GlcNAc-1-phosphate transferase
MMSISLDVLALTMAAFATAAVSSLLITPFVIRISVARGLLDFPGGRRIHTRAVPTLGGTAVLVGMLSGLAILWLIGTSAGWSPRTSYTFNSADMRFLAGLLLGGGALFVTGFVDDLVMLRPGSKLLMQTLAALALYNLGFRIDAVTLTPGVQLAFGWLSFPVTVAWIIGITNAFNLIDGLDGLASGIAIIALITSAMASVLIGYPPGVMLCGCLAGALLGFLRHNFSPARIFLGNSGSLLVGVSLAALTVKSASGAAGPLLIVVPLFAMAVPILDTTISIARRWLRGVPISSPDSRHIHHQLLALGLSHRGVAMVLCLAAALIALVGVTLPFVSPPVGVWIAAAGGALGLLILPDAFRRLHYHEFEETGSAVVSGVRKARRAIRDRIGARDTADQIGQIREIGEVSRLLESNAARFEFLHMEICRESAAVQRDGDATRLGAWKLDYPVYMQEGNGDPIVLRVWCRKEGGFRPYGAERVARIVGPALEDWLKVHAWVDLGRADSALDEADGTDGRVIRLGITPR